jgi:peptide/nickel transport system permease protein
LQRTEHAGGPDHVAEPAATEPGRLGRLLARRAAPIIPRLIGVVTLVFLFIHLIPGDPVDVMLGETAQPADKDTMRRALGLDRPLPEQYVRYLRGLAHGDLGESFAFQAPVWHLVTRRYPATLELALAAVSIALCIAVPLGTLAAAFPRTLIDRGSVAVALLGVSVPNFALGPLLIIVFSIGLEWLPVSGRGSPAHLILPAVTLGIGMAGILARMTRTSLLETLREDYVRTARAKGLPTWRVLLIHALRNALLPVVTIAGLQFGTLLAGAIITESIFAWPGIGRLTVDAIAARDYPLVQGCVLAIGIGYVVVNTATDLAYTLIDPRLRQADPGTS